MKYRRVLLFNPARPEPGTTCMHFGDFRPPMGLGYIATMLKKTGIDVNIVDNYVERQSTCDNILNFKPDLVGVYMNSPGYFQGVDLINEIREVFDGQIIVGGPQASLLPSTIPNFVDHIIMGEGEYIVRDMCLGQTWPSKIIDNRSSRITHLDFLSFPDYELFKGPHSSLLDTRYNFRFGELFGHDRYPVLTMHTSRSCPYRCSFCGVSSIWSRKYTKFSYDKVVNEIERLVLKYGAQGIYFREDLFTCDRHRLRKICDELIERKIDIIWACEARADIHDSSLLELMYRAGCRGLYVGVESGSNEGLRKKCKDLTKDDIRKFFELTKKSGIGTYATFCLGTPGETDDEITETLEFIDEIKPTSFDKFPYLGLPISQDYNILLTTGDYYHIDASGIIFTERFYNLMQKMYDKSDHRNYFLNQQRKFLDENIGKLSNFEIKNYKYSPIVDFDISTSQTINEVVTG